MDATVEQITAQVQTLTPTQQQQILEFMRTLHVPPHTPTPPGTPGTVWKQLDGSFSPEDLASMEQAIEEDCENIDYEGWDLVVAPAPEHNHSTATTHTVWRLIAHHENEYQTPDQRATTMLWIRRHSRIALGWGQIGTAAHYGSPAEITAAIRDKYPMLRNSTCGGKALWHFQHTMQKSDFIIITGPKGRELVAEVKGPYRFEQNNSPVAGDDYWHQRSVSITSLDPHIVWQAAGGREPGSSPYCALVRCARPVILEIGETQ